MEKILDDLGSFLRHVISGVPIVLGIYLVHPNTFLIQDDNINFNYAILLAVIGVALGNLAYIVNRMGLISLLEAFIYCITKERKSQCLKNSFIKILPIDFSKRIRLEIDHFYENKMIDNNQKHKADVTSLVKWRDSASIYMLVSAESLAYVICNGSIYLENSMTILKFLFVIITISGFWSYLITRLIIQDKFLSQKK